MSSKYIEIDSTYRDRTDPRNPGPAQFNIRTMQQEDRNQSLNDPISNQVTIVRWRKADFSIRTSDTPSTFATRQISNGIQLVPVTKPLLDGSPTYIGHHDELYLTTMLTPSAAYNGILQPLYNYYWGANVSITTNGSTSSARILDYRYLNNNQCVVRLSNSCIINDTSAVEITDPSFSYGSGETSGRSDSWEFVPGGPPTTSYIGSTIYIYNQGAVPSEDAPETYIITDHDKDRNLIQINGGVNLSIIGTSDTFVIRDEEIHGSSLRNRTLHDYFGTSLFTGSTPDYLSSFVFHGDENLSNLTIDNFVELSKPVEYGHVLVNAISETQFTISAAGDPNASTSNDAYVGCTCRFIMDKGSPDFDYVSEDREITAYIGGTTRTITIDKALNNSLAEYTVLGSTISIMIFSPTVTRRITKIHDYSFQVYPQTIGGITVGITGTDRLNLMNYTINPSQAAYFDETNWVDINGNNIYPYTSSADTTSITEAELFGASNMPLGSAGPLKDKFVSWNDGGVYRYGYVTDHVVQFQDNRTGRRYQYNYLIIDTDLGGNLGVIPEGGAAPTLAVKQADLDSPFDRNPYAKYATDTKINLYNIIHSDGDNAMDMILPQQVTDHKYKISLVNLSLPNKPLACSKGGNITEYPYVYVKLRTKNNSNKDSNGTFYSMNPNYKQKDFRVIVDNVVDDLITSHVSLRSSDMEIEGFSFERDDEISFGVYMPDGDLFQTIERDQTSPNRPNPTLQISAVFELTPIIK